MSGGLTYSTLFNWFDDESEIVFFAGDEIFLTGPGSPGVDTAKTHLTLLEVNLGEWTLHKIAGVVSPDLIFHGAVVEVVDEVIEGAGLHRGIAVELESPTLAIHDAEPAHIGMIACLLRTDIGEVLIGNAVLIDTEEL